MTLMTPDLRLNMLIFLVVFMLGPVCMSASSDNAKLSETNIKSFASSPLLAEVKGLKSQLSLADKIKQHPEDHLLIFFTSWCEFCKTEIARFIRTAKQGKCSRVSFVSLDESIGKLNSYLSSIPEFGSEVFWDSELKLKKQFLINRIPAFVYLDRKRKFKKFGNGSEMTRLMIDMTVANGEGRLETCI